MPGAEAVTGGSRCVAQDVRRTATSLLLATTLVAVAPMPAAAATRTVEAGTGGARVFAPRTLGIARGDRIRWDSVSGSHDVTSRLAGYFQANGQLASTGEYTRTFRAAGRFGYFCAFHSGMTGTIVVSLRVSLSGGLFTDPGRQRILDRHAMAQPDPGAEAGLVRLADHRHDDPGVRDIRPGCARDVPVPLGRGQEGTGDRSGSARWSARSIELRLSRAGLPVSRDRPPVCR